MDCIISHHNGYADICIEEKDYLLIPEKGEHRIDHKSIVEYKGKKYELHKNFKGIGYASQWLPYTMNELNN